VQGARSLSGEVGVRSVVLLPPSAYWCQTQTLQSSRPVYYQLVSVMSRTVDEEGIMFGTIGTVVKDSESLGRRLLQGTSRNCIEWSINHVERARLTDSCLSVYLNALQLASVGLKMDNSTVRVAVGLRLGAPIVSSVCVCAKTVIVTTVCLVLLWLLSSPVHWSASTRLLSAFIKFCPTHCSIFQNSNRSSGFLHPCPNCLA